MWKPIFILILLAYGHCLHSQERYSNVNGQNYLIKEIGQGEIIVIFENGMSDSLEVWGAIPDSVAKFAKVFLYDRADIAKSDTSSSQRILPTVVSELRSILRKENINPPYILVGHSYGGMIIRYFASEYSNEVKGLLLIDPCPESFWDSMTKEELGDYINGGNEWYETKFTPKYRKEWYQFIPNMKYMKNLHIDKNLPITLVSATAWEWYKYHEDILTGFNNTKHVELDGEHHIYKDHPDSTVKYIKELVIGALSGLNK